MFKLEFDTGNAAFADDYREETLGILLRVGARVKAGVTEGRILDSNGNHIGRFKFSGDGEW